MTTSNRIISGGHNLSKAWKEKYGEEEDSANKAFLYFIKNCTNVKVLSSSSISAAVYLISGFGKNDQNINDNHSPYRCIRASSYFDSDEGSPVTSMIIKLGIMNMHSRSRADYIHINLPKGRRANDFEVQSYNTVKDEATIQSEIYYKTMFPKRGSKLASIFDIDMEPSCPGIINWAAGIPIGGNETELSVELYKCLSKVKPRKEGLHNIISADGNIDDFDMTEGFFGKTLRTRSKVFINRKESATNKSIYGIKHKIWFIAMELADGYSPLGDHIKEAVLETDKLKNEFILNQCMYEYVKFQKNCFKHHDDAHWGNFLYNPNISHYGQHENVRPDLKGRALIIDFGRLRDMSTSEKNAITANDGVYCKVPSTWERINIKKYRPHFRTLQNIYGNGWCNNCPNWLALFNITNFKNAVEYKKRQWIEQCLHKFPEGELKLFKIIKDANVGYKKIFDDIKYGKVDERGIGGRVKKLNKIIRERKAALERQRIEIQLKEEQRKNKEEEERKKQEKRRQEEEEKIKRKKSFERKVLEKKEKDRILKEENEIKEKIKKQISANIVDFINRFSSSIDVINIKNLDYLFFEKGNSYNYKGLNILSEYGNIYKREKYNEEFMKHENENGFLESVEYINVEFPGKFDRNGNVFYIKQLDDEKIKNALKSGRFNKMLYLFKRDYGSLTDSIKKEFEKNLFSESRLINYIKDFNIASIFEKIPGKEIEIIEDKCKEIINSKPVKLIYEFCNDISTNLPKKPMESKECKNYKIYEKKWLDKLEGLGEKWNNNLQFKNNYLGNVDTLHAQLDFSKTIIESIKNDGRKERRDLLVNNFDKFLPFKSVTVEFIRVYSEIYHVKPLYDMINEIDNLLENLDKIKDICDKARSMYSNMNDICRSNLLIENQMEKINNEDIIEYLDANIDKVKSQKNNYKTQQKAKTNDFKKLIKKEKVIHPNSMKYKMEKRHEPENSNKKWNELIKENKESIQDIKDSNAMEISNEDRNYFGVEDNNDVKAENNYSSSVSLGGTSYGGDKNNLIITAFKKPTELTIKNEEYEDNVNDDLIDIPNEFIKRKNNKSMRKSIKLKNNKSKKQRVLIN